LKKLQDGSYEDSPPMQRQVIDEVVSKYRKYGGKVLDCYAMLSAEHGDILILPYAGGWYDQPPDDIKALATVQSVYRQWIKDEHDRMTKEGQKGNSTGVFSSSMTFADAQDRAVNT